MDSQQEELPFAEADAAGFERHTLLRLAVAAVGGDLSVRVFCDTVFEYEDRGREYAASYKDICRTPNGLCCSKESAERVVKEAVRFGLIKSFERFDGKARLANRYAVNWEGVSRILKGDRVAPGRRNAEGQARREGDLRRAGGSPNGSDDAPPNDPREGLAGDPRGLAGDPRGLAGDPRGLAGDPRGLAGDPRSSEARFIPRTRAPVGEYLINTNTPVRSGSGPVVLERRETERALPASPILQAATRRVVALPPVMADGRDISHGVFATLTIDHLRNDLAIIGWFRRQLGAIAPVLGDSEAELLLAIAAATHAVELDPSKIIANRVACFVSTIRHAKWQRAMRFVPSARERLDRAHTWAIDQRHESLPWFETEQP